MRQIPKTTTADNAETSTERLGQYKEQQAQFLKELTDIIEALTVDESSALIRSLHESLQECVPVEYPISYCEACDRWKHNWEFEPGDDCCAVCERQARTEERAEIKYMNEPK